MSTSILLFNRSMFDNCCLTLLYVILWSACVIRSCDIFSSAPLFCCCHSLEKSLNWGLKHSHNCLCILFCSFLYVLCMLECMKIVWHYIDEIVLCLLKLHTFSSFLYGVEYEGTRCKIALIYSNLTHYSCAIVKMKEFLEDDEKYNHEIELWECLFVFYYKVWTM